MNRIMTILLLFSYILTYAQPTIKVAVDTPLYKELDQFVITASRKAELISRAPVSIVPISGDRLRCFAAFSIIDALEGIRGMNVITPSLGFKVVNARGFTNTTNVRFIQLVDGMDVQSPHIGSPIANALGPSELDLKNAELVMGVTSALYGMNAINGLISFQTKDPFSSQGLSIRQKTGFNHSGDRSSSARLFTETTIRFAHALNDRFAFKLDFTLLKGTDWFADDRTDLAAGLNKSTGLTGSDNPAKDPVNSYGNESSNRKLIKLDDRLYFVARSGYNESNVTDYQLEQYKWSGGFYAKTRKGNEWQWTARLALLNTIYQRSNRFSLKDYLLQQYGISYKTPSFTFRTYLNTENSGHSYNLRSMAENLDRYVKNDVQWFNDYANELKKASGSGYDAPAAHQLARQTADSGRLIPGTTAYQNAFYKLRNINNWDSGAALAVKASFVHTEWTYALSKKWLRSILGNSGIDILTGGDQRSYIIVPDGNYFINPFQQKEGRPLVYSRYGIFVSASTALLADRLSVGLVLRGDQSDFYSLRINPRIYAVWNPSSSHYIRFLFQTGYRYPSIFEGFSNVNSGGVKRIGGFPVMSSGVFENAWLQSSITAFQQEILNDINTNGSTQIAAIEKNKPLLKKSPYTYLKPERIRSWELGYQSTLFEGRLSWQMDFYFNRYQDFIAQVNVAVPRTLNVDSIPLALADKTGYRPYRLWTNSQTIVTHTGGSAGFTWQNKKGTRAHANISMAYLLRKKTSDGLEDGFNTPPVTVNTSLIQEKIMKYLSAGLTMHWQKNFYWQSFLVEGKVPSYATMDVFLGASFPAHKWDIRLGASNIFNKYYITYLGGPNIGGVYYLSTSFGLAH